MNDGRRLHAIAGGRAKTHDPVAQAAALFKLVGGSHARGVWQLDGSSGSKAGTYEGARFPLHVEQLEVHFMGARALGIAASVGERRGLWLAVDVDKNWPERWPIYARILKRRAMAQATAFTDGARPEKSGKVLVFVANPLPLEDLRRLALDLDNEARQDPRFGAVDDKKREIDLYPKGLKGVKGEGGIVRMSGRHASKGFTIDRVFDADGADLDLRTVVPLPINAVPATRIPKPITKGEAHRFVRRWLRYGLEERTLADGHNAINRAIMRLAHEAYRQHGQAGASLLRTWLGDITTATPVLANGYYVSPKTGDTRNPLSWEHSGEGAWHRILAIEADRERNRSATLVPSDRRGLVWHVVAAHPVVGLIDQYVHEKGLHAGAFEISYRQIASWMGEPDPKKTWRLVQRAVKAGHLKIIHRGTQSTTKGLKTIFALVESRHTKPSMDAWAARALARREMRIIEHARAKWAEANDVSAPPRERREKVRALAREVVQVTATAEPAKPALPGLAEGGPASPAPSLPGLGPTGSGGPGRASPSGWSLPCSSLARDQKLRGRSKRRPSTPERGPL